MVAVGHPARLADARAGRDARGAPTTSRSCSGRRRRSRAASRRSRTRPRSSTSAPRRTTRRARVRDPLGRPDARRSRGRSTTRCCRPRTPPRGRSRTGSHGPSRRPSRYRRGRLDARGGVIGAPPVPSIGAPAAPRAGSIWSCTAARPASPGDRSSSRARPASGAAARARVRRRRPDPGPRASSAGSSHGGPATFEDVIVVLDLTIGGTILATGALVGRARAAEPRRDRPARGPPARRAPDERQPQPRGGRPRRRRGDAAGSSTTTTPASTCSSRRTSSSRSRSRAGSAPTRRSTSRSCGPPSGEGFTGWVAQHRQPLRVDDANDDPRGTTIPGTDDVDESMLVVPMLHDDVLVGVITLSKLGLRQFDDEDLRLLIDPRRPGRDGVHAAPRTSPRPSRLAAELRQLLDMSSALSRSLDPVAVADLHGRAPRPGRRRRPAQISDWDRADGRVRTLGCFPPRLRETLGRLLPARRLSRSPARCSRTRHHRDRGRRRPGRRPRRRSRSCATTGMRGLVMLPLVAKDQAIGLVELDVRRAARPPTPSLITLARTMAHEAAMALDNARLYETARNLADRDPLTGFFNHRYLHERLTEEVVRAVRTHRPLSVVMLDLDDFKLVNDSLRARVRRRRAGPRRGAHPRDAARLGRRGALRRRRVRADPPRDRPRGRRRRRRADPRRVPRHRRSSRRRPRSRSRSAARWASPRIPSDGYSATELHRGRGRRPVRREGRPAATGSSLAPPRSRTRSRDRPAADPRRPRRRGEPIGGSGVVGGGLSQYGSTRVPDPQYWRTALAPRGRRAASLVAG